MDSQNGSSRSLTFVVLDFVNLSFLHLSSLPSFNLLPLHFVLNWFPLDLFAFFFSPTNIIIFILVWVPCILCTCMCIKPGIRVHTMKTVTRKCHFGWKVMCLPSNGDMKEEEEKEARPHHPSEKPDPNSMKFSGTFDYLNSSIAIKETRKAAVFDTSHHTLHHLKRFLYKSCIHRTILRFLQFQQ